MSESCRAQPRIPRPAQLKGLHYTQTRFNLACAITAAALAAYGAGHFLGTKRRERYAKFYAEYDPDEALVRMNRAGLMQSGDNFEA